MDIFLGILVIIAYIAFANSIIYLRLKFRNQQMSALASEFGLNFADLMPSIWQLFWIRVKSFGSRDVKLNSIHGYAGSHLISVSDVTHNGILDNFVRGNRQTYIDVDEHVFVPTIKNATLGSTRVFSSVIELRQLINELKNS